MNTIWAQWRKTWAALRLWLIVWAVSSILVCSAFLDRSDRLMNALSETARLNLFIGVLVALVIQVLTLGLIGIKLTFRKIERFSWLALLKEKILFFLFLVVLSLPAWIALRLIRIG